MLFDHDGCHYYADIYGHFYPFWLTYLGFLKLKNFDSATKYLMDVSAPGPLNIGFNVLTSDSFVLC